MTSVTIVGAGLGGAAAGIEPQRHGFRDLTILDAADDLGGTWLHNSYPGAGCDVPSHLYSFSYATRRDWSRLCSPQQEILDYIHEVARDFGVDRFVQTNTRVTACTWDETTSRWTVEAEDGRSFEADAVIIPPGQLHQPSFLRIRGREDFGGHEFHTSHWDHDYDLRGKRVAMSCTGASAVQVVQKTSPVVDQAAFFQRTGNWFLPLKNRSYPRAV